MRHHAIATLVLVAGTTVAVGCGGERRTQTPKTAGTPATQASEAALDGTAEVAAGTGFTVTLDAPIATSKAKPGDTFTATVQTPLYAERGRLVVAKGAKLKGRIVEVDRGADAGFWIELETIDSTRGTVPITARIVEGELVGYQLAPEEQNHGLDQPGVGGGPRVGDGEDDGFEDEGLDEEAPLDVLVPKGGELHVVLVAPLVAPR